MKLVKLLISDYIYEEGAIGPAAHAFLSKPAVSHTRPGKAKLLGGFCEIYRKEGRACTRLASFAFLQPILVFFRVQGAKPPCQILLLRFGLSARWSPRFFCES
jgi:hypothetical protein